MDTKRIVKKLFLLKPNQTFSLREIIKTFDLKFGKYFYKKKYDTKDIVDVLKKHGIGKGSNIFVHSSWDAFYNYTGSTSELIDALVDLVGPEGTIAMPAFPIKKLLEKKPFNVKRSVTGGGVLAEAFRKYPGVKRSINANHSVCALGPLSEMILKDHVKSKLSVDENSPYYKICHCGDFKVVSFGLTRFFVGTIVHAVSETMYNEIPYFKSHYDFQSMKTIEYIDYDGELKTYQTYGVKKGLKIRTDYYRTKRIVKKYFSHDYYWNEKLSNLTVCCFDAHQSFETLSGLARQGIYIYAYPKK